MQDFSIINNNKGITSEDAAVMLDEIQSGRCKVITKAIKFEIAVMVNDNKKCHSWCPAFSAIDFKGWCSRWKHHLKGDNRFDPYKGLPNRCKECLDAEEIGNARIDPY